jgi:hypothetical protein
MKLKANKNDSFAVYTTNLCYIDSNKLAGNVS